MASSPARCRRRGIARRCARRRSPRYALATARREGIFDQYPDIRSPIYKGVAGEDPEPTRPWPRPRGASSYTTGRSRRPSSTRPRAHRVVGQRVRAPGAALPQSVDDPEDRISPHYRWALSLSGAEMERRLGSLVDGGYRGVRVLERGDSPRILRAEVVGTDGARPATGDQLKARLGLRDTWARS